MDLSPEKYDPKAQLLEELETQEILGQRFYINFGKFIERLQFHDLENKSEKVNEFLGIAIEKRNNLVSKYQNMCQSAETGSPLILQKKHEKLQKELIKDMDYLIEETKYLRLPKDLHLDTKKEVNEVRTKIIEILEKNRESFFYNDLGQGGELVLS